MKDMIMTRIAGTRSSRRAFNSEVNGVPAVSTTIDTIDRNDFRASPENMINPVRETDISANAGPNLQTVSLPCMKGIKAAITRIKGVIIRERFRMCPSGIRERTAREDTSMP